MSVLIPSADQAKIDELCLDLAQVSIDLTGLQVAAADIGSRKAKERSITRLYSIRRQMHALGIRHSAARSEHGGR